MREICVSIISTGREGFGTPTGSWKLQQKDIDHKSSLYGDYVDGNGNITDVGLSLEPEDSRGPIPIFLNIRDIIRIAKAKLESRRALKAALAEPVDERWEAPEMSLEAPPLDEPTPPNSGLVRAADPA